MNSIREDAATRLGISQNIDLKATRIYFFTSTSSRDDARPADHSPDSLGTILVALPGHFEGGDAIISTGTTTQRIKLDTEFSWVAYKDHSSARITQIINGQLILVSFDIIKAKKERKRGMSDVLTKKAIQCTKTSEVSEKLILPIMENIKAKLDAGRSVGILLPKK